MSTEKNKPIKPGFRRDMYEVIFEAETPFGRTFDVLLLWAISLSVAVVALESVAGFNLVYGEELRRIEWFFTIIFSLEYLCRIYCSRRPALYIFSFFGIIDLLSVIPSYLSLLLTGTHYLMVVRILRMLRVFRVLKMTRYLGEATVLMAALRASRVKITVFIGAVLSIVVIVGAIMHLLEGPENGFTSIPKGMYWAIVTLTTVGYGDVAPQTVLGQSLAAVLMILGYGIIAVPTGIVSVEISKASSALPELVRCMGCGYKQHEIDAAFCKKCGAKLEIKGDWEGI